MRPRGAADVALSLHCRLRGGRPGPIFDVMNLRFARSTGMEQVLAAPAREIPDAAEVAFEELFRRSFADVYSYVAGLLRDRSAAEVAGRRAALRAAMAGLEPRERELVALKFFADLGNAEIATVIGTSETNAGTRLHRVIEKLRRACDEAE